MMLSARLVASMSLAPVPSLRSPGALGGHAGALPSSASGDATAQEREMDMPAWREDALKGAVLGALIFLGLAMLFGGVAYWL
jgi:hypothetical protein